MGNDDNIQAAVGKLDKLTRVEASLVGAETLTQTRKTGRVVDDVAVTVTQTNTLVQQTGIEVGQMSFKMSEIQETLGKLVLNEQTKAADDPEKLEKRIKALLKPSKADTARTWYEKINKARIPGTGDWIREESIFKDWMERKQPAIFVSGIPGAGKSFLSSNIITFLRDQYPQGVQDPTHISIGYFFFKEDNPDTRSFHQALRDLAFQISQNDPAYQKYLLGIEDYESISDLDNAWTKLFGDFFLRRENTDSSVYILFDAVDEALDSERSAFLGLAKDVLDAPPEARHLQLAVVGRPQLAEQLVESLGVEIPTIHVTSEKNTTDIDQYIKTSIKKSPVLRRLPAALRTEVAEKLLSGADGMFIWVNLMLQELFKKAGEASIRQALKQAPKGIKQMLRHVLERFSASADSEDEKLFYLNELLLWTTCAARPLTLMEVEAILQLKSPSGDGMVYPEGPLRKDWASFFTLTREDGLSTADLQLIAMKKTLQDEEENPMLEDEDADADDALADTENETDFESDRDDTTITFCHASIGDFFRDENEGKVSSSGHMAIGVDILEARAHVLTTCLKVFVDDEFASKATNKSAILEYAGQSWKKHLLDVDPSQVTLEARKEIASMLATMFSNEEVVHKWLTYQAWISTEKYLTAIRQWWNDPDVLAALPDEEKQFIESTKTLPLATFKLVPEYCAKMWLPSDEWYPVFCAYNIYSYLQFQKGNEISEEDFSFTPSAEEVIEAAEWAGLEKTAIWHRRLALVLRETGHSDGSLEYLAKAVELAPDDFNITIGIAKTYVKMEEWTKALEVDLRLEQTLVKRLQDKPEEKENLDMNLHWTRERIADCYSKLRDVENRFQAFQRAIQSSPFCDRCIQENMRYYKQKGQYKELLDMLKQLEEQIVPEKDYSRLIESVMANPWRGSDYLEYFADAAMETGELEYVIETYKKAIHVAKSEAKTLILLQLEMAVARIYCEYAHDEKKAIRTWERIMNTFSSSKEEGKITQVQAETASLLAKHLLCAAIEVGVDTPESDAILVRLEKIVKKRKGKSQRDSLWWIPASAPALALGILYRLKGQEKEAADCFQPSIKRSIHILSDDDPDNDWSAFLELSNVLVAAADWKNALAVAYKLGNYPEEGPLTGTNGDSESQPTTTNEVVTSDDFNYQCDGPCRRKLMSWDNVSVCPYCFDTGFCLDCAELVRTGKMPLNMCNPKHAPGFFFIPPRPKAVAKDQMLVDGEAMDFVAWREQLRKTWKL